MFDSNDGIARGALSLVSMSKKFGPVAAVQDVGVDIRAGEFVTLLGESGSGKTTTLLMVAGFESPSSGRVVLDGVDITEMPAHRRNLGMVFQNYALFPHMNVFENVAFALKRRSQPAKVLRQRVTEALELVHLNGFETRYPRELSGGQQQRVALARATVYRPPVLLMDEPLSALDKRLRQSLQGEIQRIHRNLGTTILYVTHDQEEALALSDRVALMRQGRIEQVGSPEEMYERPRTAYTASFLGEANLLKGRVVGRDSATATVELSSGRRIQAMVHAATGGDVVVVVRPERLTLAADPSAGVEVRLEQALYLGQTVRCLGRFETGEPAVLRLDVRQATTMMSQGRAFVSWQATDATVVAAESGGVGSATQTEAS